MFPVRDVTLNGRKATAACMGRWVLVQTVVADIAVMATREFDTPALARAAWKALGDALDGNALAADGYKLEAR